MDTRSHQGEQTSVFDDESGRADDSESAGGRGLYGLAVALALLVFDVQTRLTIGGLSRALLFAVALDGVYLSKSGTLPVVVVLTVGFLMVERRAGLRWLVVVLVAAAPLGWAVHQHHASGRYSVGTSFDGINLHKGNNAGFLDHYPPRQGDSMDCYDFELNRVLHFRDAWRVH